MSRAVESEHVDTGFYANTCPMIHRGLSQLRLYVISLSIQVCFRISIVEGLGGPVPLFLPEARRKG